MSRPPTARLSNAPETPVIALAGGSAKKRPDMKMPQLRGAPGELVFRKGQMAPEFEAVAVTPKAAAGGAAEMTAVPPLMPPPPPTGRNFCSNCGAPLQGSFCSQCGARA